MPALRPNRFQLGLCASLVVDSILLNLTFRTLGATVRENVTVA
jgi:hypothetical protein